MTVGGPFVPGILPKESMGDCMTVPGLQGGGDKQNQPQDSLRTPPHVGYNSNPKGGEQSPPPTGGRSEIQDTDRVGGKGGSAWAFAAYVRPM